MFLPCGHVGLFVVFMYVFAVGAISFEHVCLSVCLCVFASVCF